MIDLSLGSRGEALIKSYETLELEAYLPTRNDVPTIGWGHTKGVKLGMKCTKEQAEKWFKEDVSEAESAVRSLPCPLTQSMFDALVSLVFNTGPSPLSTRNTIGKLLQKSNPTKKEYFEAWHAIGLWRKKKGEDLQGLGLRRAKEMFLFLEDSFRLIGIR